MRIYTIGEFWLQTQPDKVRPKEIWGYYERLVTLRKELEYVSLCSRPEQGESKNQVQWPSCVELGLSVGLSLNKIKKNYGVLPLNHFFFKTLLSCRSIVHEISPYVYMILYILNTY